MPLACGRTLPSLGRITPPYPSSRGTDSAATPFCARDIASCRSRGSDRCSWRCSYHLRSRPPWPPTPRTSTRAPQIYKRKWTGGGMRVSWNTRHNWLWLSACRQRLAAYARRCARSTTTPPSSLHRIASWPRRISHSSESSPRHAEGGLTPRLGSPYILTRHRSTRQRRWRRHPLHHTRACERKPGLSQQKRTVARVLMVRPGHRKRRSASMSSRQRSAPPSSLSMALQPCSSSRRPRWRRRWLRGSKAASKLAGASCPSPRLYSGYISRGSLRCCTGFSPKDLARQSHLHSPVATLAAAGTFRAMRRARTVSRAGLAACCSPSWPSAIPRRSLGGMARAGRHPQDMIPSSFQAGRCLQLLAPFGAPSTPQLCRAARTPLLRIRKSMSFSMDLRRCLSISCSMRSPSYEEAQARVALLRCTH
mmetsp:Transcript_23153/g.75009  ORF Transcript_23153/g.75009 Transcript_23153/m.75009 type:complete len:422 (+) Transcript_23153:920-2185(+)